MATLSCSRAEHRRCLNIIWPLAPARRCATLCLNLQLVAVGQYKYDRLCGPLMTHVGAMLALLSAAPRPREHLRLRKLGQHPKYN